MSILLKNKGQGLIRQYLARLLCSLVGLAVYEVGHALAFDKTNPTRDYLASIWSLARKQWIRKAPQSVPMSSAQRTESV
jgi:hypothetical protein